MKALLKLTKPSGEKILIGVESIISVEAVNGCTKIYSRSAMASSYWVMESVEEVYEQYERYEK